MIPVDLFIKSFSLLNKIFLITDFMILRFIYKHAVFGRQAELLLLGEDTTDR